MITPTKHERSEWARMAQDAYKNGFNGVGHMLSAAAALPDGARITLKAYDALQDSYRQWLIYGYSSYTCQLCGQRIADCKPCGCGAR